MGAITKPVESIMQSLVTPQMQDQLRAALPRHITPERMLRVCRTMLTTNPKLAACEPASIFASIVEASQLGLEPNSPLGHCYLIPFKNNKLHKTFAQLQIGYKGLLDLARRSGDIKGIYAEVVYEKDQFIASLGTEQALEHKPHEGDDPGSLRAVYAVAHFHDGGCQFVVMWRRDVERIKKSSQTAGKPDSPWTKWEPEMWRKTALKRLCKTLPQSIELARSVTNDDAADMGMSQTFVTDTFAAPQLPDDSSADDVRRRIDAAKSTNGDDEPAHGEASADEIAELHALVTKGGSEEMLLIAKGVACEGVEALLSLQSAQLVRTAIKRIKALSEESGDAA